jgi:serine/threonine protein kinase
MLASADLESITSFSVSSSASELPTPNAAPDGRSHKPYSADGGSESEESLTDKYNCYAILRKMPVLITFLEAQDGVLDAELEACGEESPERDTKWLAWIFQIVAALAVLQERLGLTHNDLHTNNILWTKTDEEFLYYKWGPSGKHYRVPTYGRVLKVIDFGRAIYMGAERKVAMISSDYYDSNDAAGMYNFGPMAADDEPQRMPNRAFDLALFSCSALRSLFYTNPEAVEGGAVLSKEPSVYGEGDWIVRASASPLFNLLWTWVVGRDKRSIFETEDGCERWDGFGLYIGLAEHAVAGVPAEQFGKEWTKAFEVAGVSVEKRLISLP